MHRVRIRIFGVPPLYLAQVGRQTEPLAENNTRGLKERSKCSLWVDHTMSKKPDDRQLKENIKHTGCQNPLVIRTLR